jgi:REP element-mobilizing transposase RayT
MSHSYSSNRIHLTFSTKNREKGISEELQTKLCLYMAGIAMPAIMDSKRSRLVALEDHAHALVLLLPTLPFAKAVQVLNHALQNDQRYKSCG